MPRRSSGFKSMSSKLPIRMNNPARSGTTAIPAYLSTLQSKFSSISCSLMAARDDSSLYGHDQDPIFMFRPWAWLLTAPYSAKYLLAPIGESSALTVLCRKRLRRGWISMSHANHSSGHLGLAGQASRRPPNTEAAPEAFLAGQDSFKLLTPEDSFSAI
jgi:hypothetical protein